jgi:hypothetical protein
MCVRSLFHFDNHGYYHVTCANSKTPYKRPRTNQITKLRRGGKRKVRADET